MFVMRNGVIAVPVCGGVDAGEREGSKIEIREKNGGRGVFAKEVIEMNSVIKLKGVISNYPTIYSIQLSKDKHLSVPPDQEATQSQDFF